MNRADRADGVVVGIDIGTTDSKGVACLADGTVVAHARVGHAVDRPAPGLVEHDAEGVWWGDTVALCRALASELGGSDRVRAVAVTTCGPCVVPVDAAGAPLRPGILYGVDTRASDEVETMNRRIGRAAIRRLGGMPLSSQSVGPKLAWVARAEPTVAARTATWHTATSFVVARLTGIAVIDHHQASYFGPFNDARRRAWDLRHAAVLDLDLAGRLPARAWPGDVAGPLTADAARATGLAVGTPVLVGTSDGPTEALAVGASGPGIVAIAYGSTTALTTFERPVRRGADLWLTDGWSPEQPCVGTALATTGMILRWAVHLLAPDEPTDAGRQRLDQAAAAVPAGANGLLVVPSFAGEASPAASAGGAARTATRGGEIIAGLTLAHARGDLYRAILEGIAFGIRQRIEAIEAAGVPVEVLRATGGGTRSVLLLQIVSDMTGRRQAVAAPAVGAATGAARLAAVRVGLSDSSSSWFQPARIVEPNPDTTAIYARHAATAQRLARAVAAPGVVGPRA